MTLEIDIWSDIVCPWCFIGTRRLESVLASLDGDVEVSHHPYVLHPEAPPEGIDLHDMLRSRYGADPQVMFERVEAAARDAGIPLDFSKQRRTYSTLAAHTLLRHTPDPRALADALFIAYFLEGRNIADVSVLTDVASPHGFAADAVTRLVHDEDELAETQQEVENAARMGVRGVPLFVFNGKLALSGAQREEVFREAIAKVT